MQNPKPTQRRTPDWKRFQTIVAGGLLACAAQAGASVTNPAIGQLLWSEEFTARR